MGACCSHAPETPSPPIPEGITRICVAGGGTSPHVARARQVASYIAKHYADKYETWFYFTSPGICGDGYYPYIQEKTKNITFPDRLKGHATMPLVWFENGPEKTWTVIGGREDLGKWAIKEFPNDKVLVELAGSFAFSEACHAACCCAYDEDDEKDREYFSTCLQKKNNDGAAYGSSGNNEDHGKPLMKNQ